MGTTKSHLHEKLWPFIGEIYSRENGLLSQLRNISDHVPGLGTILGPSLGQKINPTETKHIIHRVTSECLKNLNFIVNTVFIVIYRYFRMTQKKNQTLMFRAKQK